MYGVSIKVANFRQAIRDAEIAAEKIAKEDVGAKIDLATNLLREITPVKTGYARSRWKKKKFIFTPGGEITNDASYITRLNQGSSQQAPAFFIEQALMAAKII